MPLAARAEKVTGWADGRVGFGKTYLREVSPGTMALDAVLFALLSAAMWGGSSVISKLGLERGGSPFQAAMTVVTVSVVVYWGAVLATGTPILTDSTFVIGLFAFTGLLSTAVARVVSYNGIQRVGASVNSAGINTRPVFASLGAVVFLGEVLTLQTAFGIVVVVAGLILLALSKGGDVRGWNYSDLVFPLAAALIFATGNVLRRYGLSLTQMPPLGAVAINETAGLVGLFVFVALYTRGDVRSLLSAPRRAYAFFVGCGLMSSVALFALFEALSRGRVVVVDPISSPQSLFALLFTAVLLRDVEEVTPRLILGVVLVVVGVVVITAPELVAA